MLRIGAYELPVVGGRAQGLERPRAPSLSERPSGRARGFSLGSGGARSRSDSSAVLVDGAEGAGVAGESAHEAHAAYDANSRRRRVTLEKEKE